MFSTIFYQGSKRMSIRNVWGYTHHRSDRAITSDTMVKGPLNAAKNGGRVERGGGEQSIDSYCRLKATLFHIFRCSRLCRCPKWYVNWHETCLHLHAVNSMLTYLLSPSGIKCRSTSDDNRDTSHDHVPGQCFLYQFSRRIFLP